MDTVTLIRDILISIYLIGGILLTLALIVFAFLIFMSFRGLASIMKRTATNFEQVSEAAVEHIAKPLEEGVSAGSVAGNMAGFATGFVAGMRGRMSKKKEDEKKKKKKRFFGLQ